MPSVVVTGASRGIGYEFLRQYSSDPTFIVIGIVRNKAATDKKVKEDADLQGRTNIHILEADVTDYAALKKASEDAGPIINGSLDYLIGNAGIVTMFDAYDPVGDLGAQPEMVTKTLRDLFEVNVIANVHLFNLFMPYILKSQAKKVIVISSGFADTVFTNKYDVTPGSLYSASKAAINMLVAKYSAQYKKDGVMFLALCPGTVEVGHYKDATQEQVGKLMGMMGVFQQYAPHFQGPDTPEQSVTALRSVIDNASIEKGNGGDFLSHFGNKQWL